MMLAHILLGTTMMDDANFSADHPEDETLDPDGGRAEREQVDYEIDFFEGVLERTPDCVEVLQVLGNHYTRVGRLGEGLRVDRRLVRLCPTDSIAHYNLACSLSLTDKPTDAVRELHAAVKLGYRDFGHMDRDRDLDNVRKHPAYVRLMKRLRDG